MNKQELIGKIEGLETEAENTKFRKAFYSVKARCLDFVAQLDEPQAEKVEVPDFVAEWLKTNKYSNDIYDLFQDVEYATDSDGFIPENWKWCGEFYDWVSQESDTLYILSDAIRYGYTVKPKRWMVKAGGSEVWYLRGFRNSLDGDIVKQWCSHEGCIKFTDKSKAEAVATLIDGSVEEV